MPPIISHKLSEERQTCSVKLQQFVPLMFLQLQWVTTHLYCHHHFHCVPQHVCLCVCVCEGVCVCVFVHVWGCVHVRASVCVWERVHVSHQPLASLPWTLFPDLCAVTKSSHSFLPSLLLFPHCFHHNQSDAAYLTYFSHPSLLPSNIQTISCLQVGVKGVGIKCVALSRNSPDFIAIPLVEWGWYVIICLFTYLQQTAVHWQHLAWKNMDQHQLSLPWHSFCHTDCILHALWSPSPIDTDGLNRSTGCSRCNDCNSIAVTGGWSEIERGCRWGKRRNGLERQG